MYNHFLIKLVILMLHKALSDPFADRKSSICRAFKAASLTQTTIQLNVFVYKMKITFTV